jgi:hypothetical protein
MRVAFSSTIQLSKSYLHLPSGEGGGEGHVARFAKRFPANQTAVHLTLTLSRRERGPESHRSRGARRILPPPTVEVGQNRPFYGHF